MDKVISRKLERDPMSFWNSNYPEMMEWKPISTAPKTDAETLIAKPFLAFCPDLDERDQITICWWEPKVRGGSWAREGDTTDFAANPVLWMPLRNSRKPTWRS